MLKIAPKLKKIFLVEAKTRKTQNLNRAIVDKQFGFLTPEVGIIAIGIDNHMAITQVHVGKNTIEDMLLDEGFGINIIT